MIDRGKYSKEVIDFVIQNGIKVVKGNHEEMFFEYGSKLTNNKSTDTHWLHNGGEATIESFGGIESFQSGKVCEYIKWAENLPLFIETELSKYGLPVVISHASINDYWNERYDDDFKDVVLWNRVVPKKEPVVFNVFGHTPLTKPMITKRYVNIDTGAVFGKIDRKYGNLSAYCIETDEVISVK